MSSEFTNTITYERDADGVVVLTMDDPGQSANTMNADYLASMEAAVDRLASEVDEITGRRFELNRPWLHMRPHEGG